MLIIGHLVLKNLLKNRGLHEFTSDTLLNSSYKTLF